jgi:predicted phosphodiesterase
MRELPDHHPQSILHRADFGPLDLGINQRGVTRGAVSDAQRSSSPQAADNVDAVIYGHSHQPKIETKNGTLFFNPGSAGPRRFRLPITVGRMTAEHGKLRAEIVELSVER